MESTFRPRSLHCESSQASRHQITATLYNVINPFFLTQWRQCLTLAMLKLWLPSFHDTITTSCKATAKYYRPLLSARHWQHGWTIAAIACQGGNAEKNSRLVSRGVTPYRTRRFMTVLIKALLKQYKWIQTPIPIPLNALSANVENMVSSE